MAESPYWIGWMASSWGASWGNVAVDEPVTGGKRRPRVLHLPAGVISPMPKQWAKDDDEALLLCGAL